MIPDVIDKRAERRWAAWQKTLKCPKCSGVGKAVVGALTGFAGKKRLVLRAQVESKVIKQRGIIKQATSMGRLIFLFDTGFCIDFTKLEHYLCIVHELKTHCKYATMKVG